MSKRELLAAPLVAHQHDAIAADAALFGLRVFPGGNATPHGNGSRISPTIVTAPRKGLLVALVAAQGFDVESGVVRPLWANDRPAVRSMHRTTRVGAWDGSIDVLRDGTAVLTIGGGVLG